jgi:peroxiredoxin
MGMLRRISRWMGAKENMTNIVEGNAAPGFTLKSLDGEAFDLAALREKGPVVVAFFKVSCPVCQFTFPFLERLYKKYGGDGVTIVGISQDDARATKDFAKEYGTTFPMLLDDKNKGYVASNAYGLTNVPSIFLIGVDGKVNVSCTGFDKSGLESIARALAGQKEMAPEAFFLATESVPAHRPG